MESRSLSSALQGAEYQRVCNQASSCVLRYEEYTDLNSLLLQAEAVLDDFGTVKELTLWLVVNTK